MAGTPSMTPAGTPSMTPEELEAREVAKKDAEDKILLERSRILLKKSLEDDEGLPDVQDQRLNRIREASALARILLQAINTQVTARVNYKIAVKFRQTSNQESAENSFRDALRDEEQLTPDLLAILPYCPHTLIMPFPEFHNIMALPKKFRDVIGKKILIDDTESADALYQANGHKEVEEIPTT